jgi:hypothetical protein
MTVGGVVPLRSVKPGDYVKHSIGEVIKVLNSNPERQSASSASFGTWHIEGYAEGMPTRKILGDPNAEIEVVRKAVGGARGGG